MMKNKDKQLFLGNDIKLTDKITIHNPQWKDIVEFGKGRYWNVVNFLISKPEDYIELFKQCEIDYMQVSNFMFFYLVCKNLTPAHTKLLFGEIDLSKFEFAENTKTNEVVLWNPDNDIVIDEATYQLMVECIKKMHGLDKKEFICDPDNPVLGRIYDRMHEFSSLNISTITDSLRRGVLQILQIGN